MSLPTPPPSGRRPPVTEQLPVLRFIDAQLEHGRLEVHSYDMLYRVILMISDISLLLFPHSHVLHPTVRRHIEKLSNDIMRIFYIFGKHIDGKLKHAKRAMDTLPDLAVTEEERYENLRVWREVLQTTHAPSNNDTNMYRHFWLYYDTQVYRPFLQLHRDEPDHSVWQLHDMLNRIQERISSVCDDLEEANKIVRELDAEYTFGLWGANEAPRSETDGERQLSPIEETEDMAETITRSATTNDLLDILDEFFDSSNSPPGDDNLPIASTVADYNLGTKDVECLEEPLVGSKVPRVFTGCFLDLEESVKGLQLHRVNISMDGSEAEGSVKIKDFALCAPSTLPSPLPSPATLLERREALSTREPTWEKRIIGGQMVRSRRPHDRTRAQTVDERGGGLEAWLAIPPSLDRGQGHGSGVRSRAAQRQYTL
ncbi:hypothetical protein Q7P37_004153 [Cladosporium fusiforme]